LAWLAVPLLPLTEAIALAAGVHLFGARRPVRTSRVEGNRTDPKARIYLLSSAQRFTASMASLALVSSGESPQVMGRRAARASWVGLVLGAGFAFVHDGASRLGGLVTAAAGSATWAAWATWALLAAAIAYAAWTARSMFEVVHLAPSRNVLAGALQIGYPGLEGTAAALGVELPVRGKVELVEDTRTSTPLLAEKCGTA
jgi:hypothetical protein